MTKPNKDQLKVSLLLLSILFLWGCAHGKMGHIKTDLAHDSFSKNDRLYITPFSADNALFMGDKSNDQVRIEREKNNIKNNLSRMVADRLNMKGFKATTTKKNSHIQIKGFVTKFDHGSATKRALLGFGAGSSDFFVTVKIFKQRRLISEFEVIATSGGRAGLISLGSFIKAHLEDASEKIAEYIEKKITN